MPTPILIIAIPILVIAFVALMILAIGKGALFAMERAQAELLAWAECEAHPFTTADAAWQIFGIHHDDLDQDAQEWISNILLAAGYKPTTYCGPDKTLHMWVRTEHSHQPQDARRLFQIEGSAQ